MTYTDTIAPPTRATSKSSTLDRTPLDSSNPLRRIGLSVGMGLVRWAVTTSPTDASQQDSQSVDPLSTHGFAVSSASAARQTQIRQHQTLRTIERERDRAQARAFMGGIAS